MTLNFKTAEQRDAFARQLNKHAYDMLRSRDQGYDGMIFATDSLIDDLRAAAALVACSNVGPDKKVDVIEQCAAIADRWADSFESGKEHNVCRNMAIAIRNLGKKI